MTTTHPISDSLLRDMVVEELDWTPEVNSTRVGVAVVDGAVLLSGQVGTFPEKDLAERAALRVRGVNCVAQEITVDASRLSINDADIAKQASRALASDVGIPVDSVHAIVAGQVITLSGVVTDHVQRNSADRAVRYLKGVVDVVNLITVQPATTAAQITDAINLALERDSSLASHRIEVTVTAGAVVIEGAVDSWPERRQADSAAWGVSGVTSVMNRLLIQP